MWDATPGLDGGSGATAVPDDMDPRVWIGSNRCNGVTTLIITEIADPLNEENNRFLEIYSPNHRNCAIQSVRVNLGNFSAQLKKNLIIFFCDRNFSLFVGLVESRTAMKCTYH